MSARLIALLAAAVALAAFLVWMAMGGGPRALDTGGRAGAPVVSAGESRGSDATLVDLEERNGLPKPETEAPPRAPVIERAPVAPSSAPSTVDPAAPIEPEVPEWPPEPVGAIRGWLRAESGVFGGDTEGLLRGLTLDLVSLESPRVSARARFTPVEEDGQLVGITFETDPLPPLTFELTLSSLDGRRWSPVTATAVPPAEGIEFLCYDEDASAALAFDVVDAETGAQVEGWSASQFRLTESTGNGVLLHAGPLDLEAGVTGALQWIVEADGYAPAFGDERAFGIDPDSGRLTARVELGRGFATRLVVLGADPDRVPAAGAQVWMDGRRAGRTGQDGALVVAADEAPETLEIAWRDQEVKGAFSAVTLRRRSHLHVVLLDPR